MQRTCWGYQRSLCFVLLYPVHTCRAAARAEASATSCSSCCCKSSRSSSNHGSTVWSYHCASQKRTGICRGTRSLRSDDSCTRTRSNNFHKLHPTHSDLHHVHLRSKQQTVKLLAAPLAQASMRTIQNFSAPLQGRPHAGCASLTLDLPLRLLSFCSWVESSPPCGVVVQVHQSCFPILAPPSKP